jgi:hypothetical protein
MIDKSENVWLRVIFPDSKMLWIIWKFDSNANWPYPGETLRICLIVPVSIKHESIYKGQLALGLGISQFLDGNQI